MVHFRAENEQRAPCGYRYLKFQYGLDHANVAFPKEGMHIVVTCRDCLQWMASTKRKGPQRALGFAGGFPVRKTRY